MAVWIALIVVAVVLFAIIFLYNNLVRLRNKTENAWAAIDVQLRRRYDLIPMLVKIVQSYASHERVAFQDVTIARTSALTIQGRSELATANDHISSCLRKVFAIAEAYPDLKANENFSGLQEELSETENLLAYARQYYNDTALKFNDRVRTVPYNAIAEIFKFQEREYFRNEESLGTPEIETSG